MRATLFGILMAFTALPCAADELVLKNGKKILWASILDEGDSYSIETTEKQNIKIRKIDVEKIVIGKPTEVPPLTGATFTSDEKKLSVVDLLPKMEAGNELWKASGRTLIGAATWPSRSVASFDHEVPAEYDLSLVVERVGEGNKDFAVGISSGGSSCAYHFDAWEGSASCLALISGAESEHVKGLVFKPGKPRALKIMVRKDSLTVQVDSKPFWSTRLDWAQTSPHPAVKIPNRGKPFLVAAGGMWKIHSFSIMAQ